MDVFSVLGILVGLGAVVGGNILGGGSLSSLLNGPALMIVLGGSLGAVLFQYPPKVILRAVKIMVWVFVPEKINLTSDIDQIVAWSSLARKEGLLGLEAIADNEQEVFARKGLQLLVDGNEPEIIRECLEVDLETKEYSDFQAAKVFESLGGYAPTMGIIGSVMGLIQVMQNLSDPSMLGIGIATAFVSTIYGVSLANLTFLPISAKLKAHAYALSNAREMMMVGIVAIAEGENPRNIELKLSGFLHATT
ncbi:flagellar motor protein [methanotrophic endosymbiont of Bathymodiolus puteoserpentis (Logatchev)]|jgi:chemotaxis protein MotA|uniref:flagellar motor protein n=1 Tax=methanotrophic endosymbiont of Bathymodiolus puteoserpentis (Logatchev) TaxID=343235 RepID=UPI0013C9D122|nr:flagellar motor protein [methanotrophic endosymbiont of Bathymodiolus puteoserpentis (Logatchev)]SHE23623.1 Flagellar motor rotation protein MotA [methanotrophic endosymbiont of Bathymodiolus puteoserpentis (Logatchev)]